jgi:hypothetical protein
VGVVRSARLRIFPILAQADRPHPFGAVSPFPPSRSVTLSKLVDIEAEQLTVKYFWSGGNVFPFIETRVLRACCDALKQRHLARLRKCGIGNARDNLLRKERQVRSF